MTTIDRASAPPISASARVLAYLRLGKARIYHHAYGWLLALLLLRLGGLVNRHTAVALVLMLVMVLTSQWAGGASDDLGGFRDGSDARNYAGRPARTVAKKPLLTGALTQVQAIRFGVVCWIVGVASGLLAAYSLGWTTPLAAILLLLLAQICAVQYSVGLKLSYRPLGLELTIFYVIGCIALMPYWFVAGRLNAEILLTSALFGLWFLMVVCYGNASDRRGDSEVSRHTLAVLLPPGAFRAVLGLLFAGSVTLLALLFTATSLNPLLGLAALPVTVLHAVQLYYGAGRADWRKARFLGLMSLDLGCLGLALAFVLAG
jgi:1,4-dihydroxy-2-naphthoate polyprenyltransferase